MDSLTVKQKKEIEELVALQFDGFIKEEKLQRLDQIVCESEAARLHYVMCINLRSGLRRHSADDFQLLDAIVDSKRVLSELELDSVSLDNSMQESGTEEREANPEGIAELPRVHPSVGLSRRKKQFDSIHWQRHKIRFNAMTAVLTALAWIGFSYFVWFSTTPNNSRPNHQGEDFDFVAFISGVYKHQWADEMRPMAPNSSMAVGERLLLAEGLIEITFFDGAKVVLEAPTEFVVDSRRAGTLEVGKLTARAHNGFSIATPNANFVDLGTAFGVSVDKHGVAELHVFEGKVRAEMLDATGLVLRSETLLKGEATRVSSLGTFVAGLDANSTAFVHSLNSRPMGWDFSSSEGWEPGSVASLVDAGWIIDQEDASDEVFFVTEGSDMGMTDFLTLRHIPGSYEAPSVLLPIGKRTEGTLRTTVVLSEIANQYANIELCAGSEVLLRIELTNPRDAFFQNSEGRVPFQMAPPNSPLTSPSKPLHLELIWSIDPRGSRGQASLIVNGKIIAKEIPLMAVDVPDSLSLHLAYKGATGERSMHLDSLHIESPPEIANEW